MLDIGASSVSCIKDIVPCSVAAADVEADDNDSIVLLMEYFLKRELKHGSSNCLGRSLH